MTHTRGKDHPAVHQLAWDAFRAATDVAKRQGLYGAGQDLLKDAFSGNVRGLGPGSAEVEFDERPNEALMILTADKTEPGHSTSRCILSLPIQCIRPACCCP